jgi:hypothetical protein
MTAFAKLLAQKQRLLERLQEDDPGPHGREEIERLLAEIESALDSVDDAGPGESRKGQ